MGYLNQVFQITLSVVRLVDFFFCKEREERKLIHSTYANFGNC